MRLETLELLLATACKAGEVSDGDQRGLAKPVESAEPGAGAASPTPEDPADTPTPANTDPVEEDPWTATSTDLWAPTATRDVTASPGLDEPDPLAPGLPKDTTQQRPRPTKRVSAPIH